MSGNSCPSNQSCIEMWRNAVPMRTTSQGTARRLPSALSNDNSRASLSSALAEDGSAFCSAPERAVRYVIERIEQERIQNNKVKEAIEAAEGSMARLRLLVAELRGAERQDEEHQVSDSISQDVAAPLGSAIGHRVLFPIILLRIILKTEAQCDQEHLRCCRSGSPTISRMTRGKILLLWEEERLGDPGNPPMCHCSSLLLRHQRRSRSRVQLMSHAL